MSSETVKPARSKGQMIAIIIAAVIALVGIVLWAIQLTGGFVNTNMRNLDSWGLYIINFMWFVGLSAGGLIISSVPRVFGIKGFGSISKVATWVSVCCTILAVVLVIIDLGGPARVWHLFAYANLSSPLMWDIIVITVYLIVSVVYLWATIRFENGQGSAKALRLLSAIALITAILVHTVTAWIFGLQQGHELWYTALLGPWFVSSALVSGLALVLIVVVVLNKTGYLTVEAGTFSQLAKLLGVFTAVDLYFFACDLLTAGFPGGDGALLVSMLVTGPLAPFFWCEILAGIVAMLVAFIPNLRTRSLIIVASILSVLGIFAKRVQLLVGGFQQPNIDYVTVTTGPPLSDIGSVFANVNGLVYFPSLLEFGIVGGVLGLGVFLLLLGLRVLPLKPGDDKR